MVKMKYTQEIDEFKTKGFVKSMLNDGYLLTKLRKQYGEYFRKFSCGHNISVGNTSRYGPYEIFGERIVYYYDIRRKEEFIDFLVKKFYESNPEPDEEIRKAFTKVLHYHWLCWFGCRHEGKERINILRTLVEKYECL